MDRGNFLTTRVSDEELARIKSKAEKANLSVSDYVRNCVESSLFENEKAYRTLKNVIDGLNFMLDMASSFHERCAQLGYPEPSGQFSNDLSKTVNPLIEDVREMLRRCSAENL